MKRRRQPTRVGLISDTHGLLRPEALEALAGAAHIIHAGDIGSPDVLEGLRALAPVTVVRGNNDAERWASALPLTSTLTIDGCLFYVVHEIAHLRKHPAPGDVRVIVTGHSHRPSVTTQDDILYVNPGSAGPRRFRLPVTVAMLHVAKGRLDAQIHELPVGLRAPAHQ